MIWLHRKFLLSIWLGFIQEEALSHTFFCTDKKLFLFNNLFTYTVECFILESTAKIK